MLLRVLHILLLSYCSLKAQEISLDKITLEDLLKIKVSSVSKSEEPYFNAPSAIFVITQDDIKRSGARTLVDALRLAPGIQVNQSNSSAWKVSSRGFHGQFSNKLLVLIDGRSIYTPTFSGVYWDANQVFIEDVERIEVIRGPGSTIWGSNAVNGVINIITKNSKDTEGGLLRLGLGDRSWETSVRYGYALNEDKTAFMKFYFQQNDFASLDRGSTNPNSSGDAGDRWDHSQMGFRFDWNATEKDSIRISGDYYKEDLNEFLAAFGTIVPGDATGENILFHYRKENKKNNEFNVRLYYDHFIRDTSQRIRHEVSTYDLDLDYLFPLGENHLITTGAGYRLINTELDETNQARDNYHLFSAFIQDKITLIKNKLDLTVGTKYEHIELNGNSLQPSLRLSYMISEKQTLWMAYAHSKRTPSFLDDNVRTVATTNGFVINGSNDTHSETVNSYEIGYRHNFSDRVSTDIAIYYNSYSDLIAFSGIPNAFANNIGNGSSYGFEISSIFDITPKWRLTCNYTFTKVDFDFGNYPGTIFTGDRPFINSDQETVSSHLVTIDSRYRITEDIDFNINVYYVDDYTDLGLAEANINDYIKLDARLAWRPTKTLELSLNAYNLLSPSTRESTSFSEVPRSFLLMATYKF